MRGICQKSRVRNFRISKDWSGIKHKVEVKIEKLFRGINVGGAEVAETPVLSVPKTNPPLQGVAITVHSLFTVCLHFSHCLSRRKGL